MLCTPKTAESITGGVTETDPVFGASIANGITALGFVAGFTDNFYLGQDTLGGIVYYI